MEEDYQEQLSLDSPLANGFQGDSELQLAVNEFESNDSLSQTEAQDDNASQTSELILSQLEPAIDDETGEEYQFQEVAGEENQFQEVVDGENQSQEVVDGENQFQEAVDGENQFQEAVDGENQFQEAADEVNQSQEAVDGEHQFQEAVDGENQIPSGVDGEHQIPSGAHENNQESNDAKESFHFADKLDFHSNILTNLGSKQSFNDIKASNKSLNRGSKASTDSIAAQPASNKSFAERYDVSIVQKSRATADRDAAVGKYGVGEQSAAKVNVPSSPAVSLESSKRPSYVVATSSGYNRFGRAPSTGSFSSPLSSPLSTPKFTPKSALHRATMSTDAPVPVAAVVGTPTVIRSTSGRNFVIPHKPVDGVQSKVDVDVATVIQKILSEDGDVSWGIFTYNKSLSVYKTGSGDVDRMREEFDSNAIMYGYIRLPIGADRRNKFVFVKWIGEDVRPFTRAKAFDECRNVMEIIKVYHLELPAIRKSDLVNSVVLDKLQKSAGANYDKAQNSAAAASNTSEFVSYKQSSKAFFQNIEKGGTLGQVTYQTAPMARMTPVDLSHRVMTVGASNAKANLVDLNIRKD